MSNFEQDNILHLNRIQKYCMSKGMSGTEAYQFAVSCKSLDLISKIDIVLPEDASCDNCLYSKKCDAPTITDNRINASNCGSFINIKDILIKADVLSKLSSTTWYSYNDNGKMCEGAANNSEAYYKYSDILKILGVDPEV